MEKEKIAGKYDIGPKGKLIVQVEGESFSPVDVRDERIVFMTTQMVKDNLRNQARLGGGK